MDLAGLRVPGWAHLGLMGCSERGWPECYSVAVGSSWWAVSRGAAWESWPRAQWGGLGRSLVRLAAVEGGVGVGWGGAELQGSEKPSHSKHISALGNSL